MELVIILGLLATAFAMVSARRIDALIGNFRMQAFLLFVFTLLEAWQGNHFELYLVSISLLVIKVMIIPLMLGRIIDRIQVNEDLGFFLSPQLSLFAALLITGLAWIISGDIFAHQATTVKIIGTVAFSITFLGAFIMIFRMKALAQIVGLLAMENGIFLLSSSVSGGMPFLVEMAIFFDVFVGVIILGIFVYRINKLFVSIDVSRLNNLKG